jgi:hypothetical protein
MVLHAAIQFYSASSYVNLIFWFIKVTNQFHLEILFAKN